VLKSVDYRKRLKENDNETYLRKERERRRKNYVPSGMLSPSEISERRSKVREAVRKYRQRRRNQQNQVRNQEESMDTSGYESIGGSSENMINKIKKSS
jgi:hypothetical protein